MKILKEQEMRMLFEKWHQSGKTKIAFCQEEGLIKSTFYYWIKKFQKEKVTVKQRKPSFTPLILEQKTDLNNKQPIFRIKYISGVSIDFYDMVDAGFIKSLFQ